MNPCDTVSHYRIESLLGGGGMGIVYLDRGAAGGGPELHERPPDTGRLLATASQQRIPSTRSPLIVRGRERLMARAEVTVWP